jgi:hypothetical protein
MTKMGQEGLFTNPSNLVGENIISRVNSYEKRKED